MAYSARDTAAAQRAWLRRVLDETGLKPSTLAKKIQVWPSTLLGFLKAPKSSARTLRADTIDKIVHFTGKAPPGATDAELPPRPLRGLREEGVPFKGSGHPSFDRAVEALVEGRANADPWTLTTRAIELRGFLPGDTVIVDIGTAAQAGDVVCAQIYDWQNGKAETVFRVYEPPYLIAASSDPALQKPLLVDNERVQIKGVVLPHRLRRPPEAA